MNYVIGIPSYKRPDRQATIQYLRACGIPRSRVFVQTQTEEDYALYRKNWGALANILYAPAKDCPSTRNNLLAALSRFRCPVIEMDDDIAYIGRRPEGAWRPGMPRYEKIGRELDRTLCACVDRARAVGASLFGFYHFINPKFQREGERMDVHCIGTVFGILDTSLRFDETQTIKSDFELCARVMESGGHVVRFDRYAPQAGHGQKGGCGEFWHLSAWASGEIMRKHPGMFEPNPQRPGEILLKRRCGK